MVVIGVDTGGTFTDIVYKEGDRWGIYKLLSTPSNPAEAVLEGIEKVAGGKKRYIIHGSTVATNAILERKGSKTAFVTNKGFEDIIFIGRQNRKELYNLHYRRKESIVPEDLRFGIDCRVNSKGEIVKDISEEEIDELIKKLKESSVQSVAVCFLFSFLNPEHEKTLKEKLSDHFYVSISSQILPEFREYERSSTVVLNSYVMPVMDRYISHLEENISEDDRLLIMQSNGGSISPKKAKEESVRTILSGPAGGVVGAFQLGKMAGYEKIITFDMGGTSTDVSLLDGSIPFTTDYEITDLPVKVPVIDIHTVGAGGGSIAYIDEGGSLNVGPESAGADPGPVCYGKGERITVTDANLFLNRLIPEMFLGGNMRIYPERVEDLMKKLSSETGLDPYETAEGILTVANIKMEDAIRKISIERGYDPKEFSLFSFGGAGGLHASFLARSLGIPEVIIPVNPGVLSAFGMLMSDVIKDYSLTVMSIYSESIIPHLEEVIKTLKEKAFKDLMEEGFDSKDIITESLLDMRYKGQSYELIVPYGDSIDKRFHETHRKYYGYSREDTDIEIVNVRLRAYGITEKPSLKKIEKGDKRIDREAILGYRDVYFNGKYIRTAVIQREKLKAGNIIDTPSIIVEYSSTVVIPEFASGYVDDFGNIILSVEG
ncbi:MAG TPA: hydantoinase/oxoprolinase family protein [Persephonella sp.]|uniref:Hydantoin utilization protein A (ORF2) n=2 Tax=Persephonella TaxID=182899 RepID=C0QRE4_PERMH|nr:hydantoin utilization protein A (ORF2) [Persephonella marina EX-H1]HCB68986.1 hydantoinase/oxoprolinase family protein [Persephonella sp.]